MNRLASRDRRVLAIGIFVVVAVLAIGRGVPAGERWMNEVQDRSWRAHTRLNHLRQAIALRDAVRDSLRVAAAQLDTMTTGLLTGSNSAAVGAALLASASEIMTDAGFHINTLQSVADSSGERFVRTSVRVDVTGDVTSLAELLAAIENDSTTLSFRSLAIDQPSPGATTGNAEALRLQMVLDGIGRRSRERR